MQPGRYLVVQARSVSLNNGDASSFILDQFTELHIGGKGYHGTLRALDYDDVPALAKWCAEVGGRGLLDAFELHCINHRLLPLEPQLDGDAEKVDDWRAEEFQHTPEGLRIVWTPLCTCPYCGGTGNAEDDPGPCDDDEPDPCWACDAKGKLEGPELVTDADGVPIQPELSTPAGETEP